MIDVMIITYNEAANLPHALRSVTGWARNVFVIDSQSTDSTREIAEQMGAKFVVQPWLGYARQKNWALDNLPFESDWIFILDADESITPELRDEILGIAGRPASEIPQSGFYVNRLTFFMGRPIRHCGFFPSYNLRFFKRGRARYEEREVHEHMIVDGRTATLRQMMHHEDRRGLEHFIAKHNRYSTLEARELMRARIRRQRGGPVNLERGIAVRRWLKHNVLPRLPLTGVSRFIYMYFLRLGFLDGVTGYRFCLLLATYDTFISLKLAELRALGVQSSPELIGSEAVDGQPSLAPPRLAPPPPVQGLVEAEGTMLPTLAGLAPPGPRQAGGASARRRPPGLIISRSEHRSFAPQDAANCPRPPVSVVILTYNEEINIRACIESCAWCDDVHVLDSGSQDRTREVAAELGATVHVNPFKSFGQQRTWAIEHIPCRHRWHFHLDADERFTPALVREMAERLRADGSAVDGVACYRCPSMMMFMEQWVRHAAEYPVYQVRLFDRQRCRFEDYGHGQREVVAGDTGVLDMPYLHYSFSKGLEEWFDKHNRYSTLEAVQALSEPPVPFVQLLGDLLSRDSVRRRRRLKAIGYRMPAKSVAIMVYMLLLRRGFLDGAAGWNYARMRAIYEGMIAVKMAVFRRMARSGAGHEQGPRA